MRTHAIARSSAALQVPSQRAHVHHVALRPRLPAHGGSMRAAGRSEESGAQPGRPPVPPQPRLKEGGGQGDRVGDDVAAVQRGGAWRQGVGGAEGRLDERPSCRGSESKPPRVVCSGSLHQAGRGARGTRAAAHECAPPSPSRLTRNAAKHDGPRLQEGGVARQAQPRHPAAGGGGGSAGLAGVAGWGSAAMQGSGAAGGPGQLALRRFLIDVPPHLPAGANSMKPVGPSVASRFSRDLLSSPGLPSSQLQHHLAQGSR